MDCITEYLVYDTALRIGGGNLVFVLQRRKPGCYDTIKGIFAPTHLYGPAIHWFSTKNMHDVMLKVPHCVEAVFLCHRPPKYTEKPSTVGGAHRKSDAEVINLNSNKWPTQIIHLILLIIRVTR